MCLGLQIKDWLSLSLSEEAVKRNCVSLVSMQLFTFHSLSEDDSGCAGGFPLRVLLRRNTVDTEKDQPEPVTDYFIYLFI